MSILLSDFKLVTKNLQHWQALLALRFTLLCGLAPVPGKPASVAFRFEAARALASCASLLEAKSDIGGVCA